ncbi:MAG: ComEC/Rec2 family competence protein, partial [Cyclobacteriaceae bacterium]
MFRWAPFPLVRISIITIAGIILYEHFPLAQQWLWSLAMLFLTAYVILFFILKNIDHLHFRHFFGIIGLSALFFFIQLRSSISDPANQPDHLVHHARHCEIISGTVISPGEETRKTFRYKFAVNHIKDTSKWISVKGNLHLYISKTFDQHLKPGDQLLLKANPDPVAPPLNPEQFDYRNYLARQNVHHQLFVNEKSYIKTGNQICFINQWAHNIREYAIEHFARLQDLAARGVVQGLVLGSKDNIDDITKNAYTAAGLMHILAVSGLHVGIIYGILILIFGHLRNYRSGKIYFAIICVTVLWFYALITGLSPSVVRASVMFSFFALAETTRKQKNSYNILAASAFLMLLVNPDVLFTVSFQLSYLAVLGIIYLQPILQDIWQAPNLITKR